MKWLVIITSLFLLLAGSSFVSYAGCESECKPVYSCATLLECRMAEIDCKQACRQRKVLEGLAEALGKIAFSLDNSSMQSMTEGDILSAPITLKVYETPAFPVLGVHRRQESIPFMQIDRGSTVIISDDDE